MKKVLLVLGVVSTVGMISCGGVDPEAAGKEFCECKDKEGDAQQKCYDDWVDKYKEAAGSKEDGEKIAEIIMECDPGGLMKIANKLK